MISRDLAQSGFRHVVAHIVKAGPNPADRVGLEVHYAGARRRNIRNVDRFTVDPKFVGPQWNRPDRDRDMLGGLARHARRAIWKAGVRLQPSDPEHGVFGPRNRDMLALTQVKMGGEIGPERARGVRGRVSRGLRSSGHGQAWRR